MHVGSNDCVLLFLARVKWKSLHSVGHSGVTLGGSHSTVVLSTMWLMGGEMKTTRRTVHFVPENMTLMTSCSAIAEGPRDALSQLKSCQLLHNCTKNHI